MKGLLYTSPELAEDDFTNGSIAVMTGEDSVTVKEEWLSGAWWDGIHDFGMTFPRMESWNSIRSSRARKANSMI